MRTSLAQPSLPTPLLVTEKSRRQAKASLPAIRKTDKSELWGELGKAMVFVCYDAGLSLKEFAARLEKDERQIARQMEGQERPQIEAVFAVPEFRAPLVQALARITPEIAVQTVMTVSRRSA